MVKSKPSRRQRKPKAKAAKRQHLPINRRLGYRVREYADMLGISYVSVWRGIRAKQIDVVEINGIKFIPRAFAVKQGLIAADDASS